jgi:type VI secretion system protein ImpG
VTLFPLRISEAQYHASDLSSLGLPPGVAAKSALRVRIEATIPRALSTLKLDELTIHLRGAAELSGKLYEQIFARGLQLVTRSVSRPVTVFDVIDDWREAVGYSDAEAILPYDARSFQGYRLLREYFSLPERFLFARIKGLSPSLKKASANALDLIIVMNSQEPRLESLVSADNFALYCTPAANLFRRETDRIHLTTRAAEFPVVVDRTRPCDFEVYQVQRVTGLGSSRSEQQEFRPFYASRDRDGQDGTNAFKAYFSAHRTPRAASERERRLGRRSAYSGSETWISLVDSNNAPYRTDLKQLAVEVLCTNRDLPEHLQPNPRGESDFTWEIGGPINSARMIVGPTAPRESCSEGERAWRLISHLCLNYLSLVDVDDQQGASALRELLRLYVDAGNRQHERQIEGVRSIRARRITRRVPSPGPIVFARGLELTLLLDDAAFEGAGVYPFGSVLQRFFARYVSINSFAETVLQTRERGQVMRWPPMIGQRNLL